MPLQRHEGRLTAAGQMLGGRLELGARDDSENAQLQRRSTWAPPHASVLGSRQREPVLTAGRGRSEWGTRAIAFTAVARRCWQSFFDSHRRHDSHRARRMKTRTQTAKGPDQMIGPFAL